MPVPLEVFCCYAREDQEMLEHLKKHLMPLQRSSQITIWSDTNLNAGVEWEKELHQHLESADLILLLISPDFMSSDYCYSTEMKRAIERHDQGSAHVIPILLRPTFWQNEPFAKLQIVPTDATPITTWADRDEAFYDVIGYINRYISGQQNQQIVSDKQQENRLQAYLDRMSELLLKEGLRNSDHDSDVRSIAQVQTINILMQLDGRYLGRVFDFLRKLRLMERERNFTRSIIDLSYIDFTHVNWRSIDLSSVNLGYANFQGANLDGVNFRKADLHHVDFTGLDHIMLSTPYLFVTHNSVWCPAGRQMGADACRCPKRGSRIPVLRGAK